jgi:uncharacterized protein (DUF3820 family)
MKIKKTEPSAIVLPFGKHKGKTVAELLVADEEYANWIAAQGWVAERFAELHAAILSRGAGIDDSPEHNALQARFLEPEFRLALLRILKKSEIEDARGFLERDTWDLALLVREIEEEVRSANVS